MAGGGGGRSRVQAGAPGSGAGPGGGRAGAGGKRGGGKGRDRKERRRAEAAAAIAVEGRVRAARDGLDAAQALAPFARFRRAGGQGEPLRLEFGLDWAGLGGAGAQGEVTELLETNMAVHYGDGWDAQRAQKAAESRDAEARYITVRDGTAGSLVGFLHYRFLVEEGVDVVYVYELQVGVGARGQGVGKLLMMCAELLARKAGLQGVMLTVHKHNTAAVGFYAKLKYVPAWIDPTAMSPLDADEYDYRILCKLWGETGSAKAPPKKALGASNTLAAQEKLHRKHNCTYASPF